MERGGGRMSVDLKLISYYCHVAFIDVKYGCFTDLYLLHSVEPIIIN